MNYELLWTRPALKDLRRLDSTVQKRIWHAVDRFLENKAHIRKLTDRQDEWKLRVGDYRIILKLDRTKRIIYVIRPIFRTSNFSREIIYLPDVERGKLAPI